jgi:adhesin transport system outer membrane protein
LPNAVPLDLSRVFAPEGAAGLAGQEVAEIARPDTPSPASPGQTAKTGRTARPEGAPGSAAKPARNATAAGPVIKSAALPPLTPELLPPAGAVSAAEAPMPPAERGAAGAEPSAPVESGREATPVPMPPVPNAAAPAAEPAARPAKPGRGGKAGKATGKNGKEAGRDEKGVSDADKDKSRAAKDADKAPQDAAKSAVPAATPGGETGGSEKSAPGQKPVVETVVQAPVLPRQGLRIVALPDLVGTPPVVTVESPESLKPFVQPGDEMTLLESMRRALYYSYAVRAAAARVETTKQTERTALARLLPRVDARMSAGQAKYDATARPTPPEWMLRVDRSVTAAQPLFNWSDYMTWRQQGALVSAEKERRSNTDSATALEAASAFLSVYQAQLVIEYGEAYRELLSDLERYVSERANSGATSLADADRVRARVANAQSILAEGRASLITAMGNLRRLVGALPERVTVGPLDESILPETLNGARTEATAANPDLLASRREVDAATLERRAVFGRFMPNVELEVSQLEFRNTSGQVGTQSDSRVLVVMNIPIFAGGGDLATVRALAAKRQEKEFNLGEKERKLLFDLESAFSVIESINPRLESTRVELESNLKVVAAFREQLFASNRSLLDVLDAYQRLYQSKVDLTTLLVNEARTKLQVAHLSGRLRQILPTVEIAP